MYSLEIGKKFSSYSDVKDFVNQYENNTYTKFWKRDAKLISSNHSKRPMKSELIYSYLKYSCIYGGQQFRPKGKRERNTKTFKREDLCPAFISFCPDIKGNSLQIRKFNEEHNHERTKEMFSFLPQQRQLPDDAKENAKHLLSLRANRKLVRENLQLITGRNITLKDLSNLQRTQVKGDSLKKCIEFIKQKNSDVVLFKDDIDNFKGLFVQTPEMKSTMAAFPEFLAIDATYRLLNIGIPIFLIIIEDGNCQSEIVAICLMVTEDRESFEWFLNTFKFKNSSWTKTKCIMTDKDLLERDVIRSMFPDANLIICIFHVMKIFSREITCEKMGITSIQRKKCLEILQQLVYSRTDNEYDNLCQILKDTGYKKVYDYFEKNWLHIRDEWSMNKNYFRGSFLNTTNNRLESINSKLKQVIKKNSTLEDFIESLFVIIHSLEIERDYKAVYQFQKRSVTEYEPASDERKVIDFLTNEPARMVIKQIEYSKKVKNLEVIIDSGQMTSSEGLLKITKDSCTCNFYEGMFLPCRHIFALRKELMLPMFDINIVHRRWTKAYYKNKQRLLKNIENQDGEVLTTENNDHIAVDISKKPTVLSYAEKRKKVLKETNGLTDLVALGCNATYLQRFSVIKDLQSYWKNNIPVRIIPINGEDCEEPGIEEHQNNIINDYDVGEITETGTTHENANCDIPLIILPHQTEGIAELSRITDVEISTLNQDQDVIELGGDYFTMRKAEKTSNIVNTDNPNVIIISNEILSNGSCIDQIQNSKNDSQTQPNGILSDENNNENMPSYVDIRSIKMPGIIKKKGRPKGSDLTAIGMKKKRKNEVLAFYNLGIKRKQQKMLSWVLREEEAAYNAIQTGEKVEDCRIESDPQKVSDVVMDPEVDLSLIRPFFTENGWNILQKMLSEKDANKYRCEMCSMLCDTMSDSCHNSIKCKACLRYYHLKCINVMKIPKRQWYCLQCTR